jgi:IS6 family transposase
MFSAIRNTDDAEQLFRKVLDAGHTTLPRVITLDKSAAYRPAFESLQQEKTLPENSRLRQCKCLNNIVKQEAQFMKRRVKAG